MKRAHILVVSALLFGGCTTLKGPISPDFGNTTNAVYDQQIVSKTPASGAPQPDAQVQSNAVERYRTDAVKKPVNTSVEAD